MQLIIFLYIFLHHMYAHIWFCGVSFSMRATHTHARAHVLQARVCVTALLVSINIVIVVTA